MDADPGRRGDALTEARRYAERMALARVLGATEAARLAAMVPDRRGRILWAAARGERAEAIAAALGTDPDAVDATLAEWDGWRLLRADR